MDHRTASPPVLQPSRTLARGRVCAPMHVDYALALAGAGSPLTHWSLEGSDAYCIALVLGSTCLRCCLALSLSCDVTANGRRLGLTRCPETRFPFFFLKISVGLPSRCPLVLSCPPFPTPGSVTAIKRKKPSDPRSTGSEWKVQRTRCAGACPLVHRRSARGPHTSGACLDDIVRVVAASVQHTLVEVFARDRAIKHALQPSQSVSQATTAGQRTMQVCPSR